MTIVGGVPRSGEEIQAALATFVACYGWPRSVAQDDAEIVRRLTALNKEIIDGERGYDPFDKSGDPQLS